MKIGFASLVGLDPKPIEEVVAWAAANGFQSMEVNTGPTYSIIGDATYHGHLDLGAILNDGPEATLALFDSHGIEITALAPMINLLTRDSTLASARLAQMEQTIDAAAALGCKTVVTFTGSADGMYFYGLPGVGDDHPTNRVKDNLDRFAAIYGPLAERAERTGVRIAFETAGRGGGEGNLAHNPELWDAMFDGGAIPRPWPEFRPLAPCLAANPRSHRHHPAVRRPHSSFRRQRLRSPARTPRSSGDSR